MVKCIIIDSDSSARRALSRLLAQDAQLSIAGMYDTPYDVPFDVNKNTVDVLFIDVVLNGADGLEYVKHLTHSPQVVITTAFRDYAVECFELDILDYLVKPIEPSRLLKTLSKIHRMVDMADVSFAGQIGQADYTFIRVDKKKVKLPYSSVLYVESIKDYICIHTVSEQYIIHQTLSGFTASLPQDSFVRIHRSYTVNLHHVEALSGSSISVSGKTLPIGRNYLADTRERIIHA
ncbi:MAG: LytTR family DNA-binding domain-containing protein [Flavobacteriales bacterium]|nr:LytTR family DNA-binding domain-containing protein [Flavobacteriales bacterium]